MPAPASKLKIARVLERIAQGASLNTACAEAGLCPSLFLREADPALYTQAQALYADLIFDELASLEEKCLDGDLNPTALRAILDCRKWRLARLRPDIYGERSSSENPGPDTAPLQVKVRFVNPAADETPKEKKNAGERREEAPGEGGEMIPPPYPSPPSTP